MKKALKSMSKPVEVFALVALLVAGTATRTAQAQDWHATVGGESPDRGRQLSPSRATEPGRWPGRRRFSSG